MNREREEEIMRHLNHAFPTPSRNCASPKVEATKSLIFPKTMVKTKGIRDEIGYMEIVLPVLFAGIEQYLSREILELSRITNIKLKVDESHTTGGKYETQRYGFDAILFVLCFLL